ncbi:uncharacterized protein MONBRDRAFT_9266 [Monosiga brevicollis MX1]|uniref:JmjC domain-containing protein n=1 Tax=Monosiga brevicollis TaxID=81824 RepID=A9V2L4_MONBE|nr:uncharacterized protein MONBRDRAFT_9266 [Monosiga brevicollis MX1]EDQ88396.1 predicted protein [Monosiga brevicollis MX1]|eukprot:XP_001746989.1 hypothetical protein [Monosiga brevicollis MX1]
MGRCCCCGEGDGEGAPSGDIFVLLARHMRRAARAGAASAPSQPACPQTRLVRFARSAAGRELLVTCVRRTHALAPWTRPEPLTEPAAAIERACSERSEHNGVLEALLGALLLLRQPSDARLILDNFRQLQPGALQDGPLVKVAARALLADAALTQRAALLADPPATPVSARQAISYTPVTEVEAEHLTVSEFQARFVRPRRPVVIRRGAYAMSASLLSLDTIRELAGESRVQLRRPMADSVNWARLEDAQHTTVSDFLERLATHQAEDLYLFDWSLPVHCPDLAARLQMPKWVDNDYLTQQPAGQRYQAAWPSLFIGPKHVSSAWHVDVFGTHFYMAMMSGEKEWIFLPPAQLPLLYPDYSASAEPIFEVVSMPQAPVSCACTCVFHSSATNLFVMPSFVTCWQADVRRPDEPETPAVQYATPMRCVLRAGDLLFVPGGSPHTVTNLTDTIAVRRLVCLIP